MFRRHILRMAAVTVAFLATVTWAGPASAAVPDVLAVYELPVIIGNIRAWITGLLFGVASLFAAIGGLRRVTANGDPTEIEKSNAAFKNAFLGYALAIVAPILLTIVQGWIGG
jgi:hypothetical protein